MEPETKKIQLGKHSISYGEKTKTIINKAGTNIGKLIVRLLILYFIWIQLYNLWGFQLTLLTMFFYFTITISDGLGEFKKIREQLEKLNETNQKPDWKQ
jgi:ABC-type transport system involved in Fe-S cluster assembly fused permease/ATPase subunit